MAKKTTTLTTEKSLAIVPRQMMLQRFDENGEAFYWSRLGWSDIYAMPLDEETAKTHAERLSDRYEGIIVVPFAKVNVNTAAKNTKTLLYVR